MNTNIINKKKLITSIIFKAISLIASVYGLVFTIDSIKSFTFFTTLSNVALDIVLAVFIVLDVILLTKGKDYKNNGLYILKFLMTLSITLTCVELKSTSAANSSCVRFFASLASLIR